MSLTREEAIQIAWHKGALKFLLRPHQFPIYDAIWSCLNDTDPTHVSHVVNCARQFGKSFTEMTVAVEFCIRFPKSTVLFVAPLKSQAKEIVNGGTYFRIFETCPSDPRPYSPSPPHSAPQARLHPLNPASSLPDMALGCIETAKLLSYLACLSMLPVLLLSKWMLLLGLVLPPWCSALQPGEEVGHPPPPCTCCTVAR